jgi:hypothetical protein
LGPRMNTNEHESNRLPGQALEAGDTVEVMIAAEEGEAVLAREGGNPEVVHGDGSTCHFEFEPDLRVMNGSVLVHGEAVEICELPREPSLMLMPEA